jgi:hypothetical protein
LLVRLLWELADPPRDEPAEQDGEGEADGHDTDDDDERDVEDHVRSDAAERVRVDEADPDHVDEAIGDLPLIGIDHQGCDVAAPERFVRSRAQLIEQRRVGDL